MSPKTLLRKLLTFCCPPLIQQLDRSRAKRAEIKLWEPRIADALASPDNRHLPRHPESGQVQGDFQVMFNGVKVATSGYYGIGMTELLRKNRGSHEPQEEVVFAEVLRRLPPGARMVECGAYWGFYSLWFARDIPQAKVWLIEPEAANLQVGQRNFTVNNLTGHFTQALVGAVSEEKPVRRVNIDDFLATQQIEHLDVLHADIQGAEVEMLHGAVRSLTEKRIDFLFISTHGDELQTKCMEMLTALDYDIAVSVYPAQSYSFDGLLVCHRQGLLASPLPAVALKPPAPPPHS